MALKHTDVCTILNEGGVDRDILTRENFDVNMRLFDTSPGYHRVVLAAALYIRLMATTTREGYKKPHGFSGANAGIPFRIIALADGTVMLNPRIVEGSGRKKSMSNCGSLVLDKPIKIVRYRTVEVEYYDMDGRRQSMSGYLPTVQHEIDHCDGLLITDRVEGGDAWSPNR